MCGKNINCVVRCSRNLEQVEVLKCHAMTFSQEYNNKTVVGASLMH